MKRCLYIIEDDEPVRRSLEVLFTVSSSWNVRSFTSGDEFLSTMPKLDRGVIALDMNMPGTSGLDVLVALQAATKIPYFAPVVVTGQGDLTTALKSMKEGAFDFIEKPYKHCELIAALTEAFWLIDQTDALAIRKSNAERKLACLSSSELAAFQCMVNGWSNRATGLQSEKDSKVIELYRTSLMYKLGASTIIDALRIAFSAGLVTDEGMEL